MEELAPGDLEGLESLEGLEELTPGDLEGLEELTPGDFGVQTLGVIPRQLLQSPRPPQAVITARAKTNFTVLWEGPAPVPPNNAERRVVRGPENVFSNREPRKGSPALFGGMRGTLGARVKFSFGPGSAGQN